MDARCWLPSRLTGIEFQDGGRVNTIDAPGGILHVDGSNTNAATFRFDHCKWNDLNGSTVFDTVIGVIDHNTFVIDRFGCAIYLYGSHWDGQDYGDGSWQRSDQLRFVPILVHRGQHLYA